MNFKNIAKTPPMGWNSWDCYGASVTEEEVIANAQYMAKNLQEFGWEYIVVDIQWYEPEAKSSIYNGFFPLEMDQYSRVMPAVNRFPSAKNGQGFKPLADKIHALGLKFGIHIMRGIPRQAVHQNTPIKGTIKTARDIAHINSICPWNTDMYGVDATKEGAQAYYDSLFELYASWGVDFIKVDDIADSRLYGIHLPEIEMIRKAIDGCGREMVLSLSPGPAPIEYAEFLKNHANMWRMTDDFWDKWSNLYPMFERCAKWAEHVGDGSWPDCDMLPLGHIGIRSVDGFWDEMPFDLTIMKDRYCRFTKDEQKTMMTLWCIFRSPLMFGGELRDNDEWTNSLLTNKELLHMHQTITKSYQASRQGDMVIWQGIAKDKVYLAAFNTGEEQLDINLSLSEYGIFECTNILDVWNSEEIEVEKNIKASLPPHGAALFKMEKDK